MMIMTTWKQRLARCLRKRSRKVRYVSVYYLFKLFPKKTVSRCSIFSGPYHVCQAVEINFLLLLSGRFENFYTSYICLFILFFNRQYYQFFYITCDSRKMHDFINFHSFFLFILSTEMSIAKHYTKL